MRNSKIVNSIKKKVDNSVILFMKKTMLKGAFHILFFFCNVLTF